MERTTAVDTIGCAAIPVLMGLAGVVTSLIGEPRDRSSALLGAMVFLLPGALALAIGLRGWLPHRRAKDALLEASSSHPYVDCEGLGIRLGLSHGQIRDHLSRLKERGLIPTEVRDYPEYLEDAYDIDALRDLCNAYRDDDQPAIAALEPRATAIGEEAYRSGGIKEMRAVFALLRDRRGARTLEMHWGGIGEWRG